MYDLKPENSKISADLITRYLSANYKIMSAPKVITLSINQPSKPLLQLFVTSGHQCAVFITAFNPLSQLKSSEENRNNNTRLLFTLKKHTNHILDSVSSDQSEQYAIENSFFALGIDLQTAKKLGKQFNQNAIVWIGTDASPHLILLR